MASMLLIAASQSKTLCPYQDGRCYPFDEIQKSACLATCACPSTAKISGKTSIRHGAARLYQGISLDLISGKIRYADCFQKLLHGTSLIKKLKSVNSSTFCQADSWAEGRHPPISVVQAVRSGQRRLCECHDFYEKLVPFVEAWRWQKETVHRMSEAVLTGEDVPDSVVLLQHPPVYTMGTHSSDSYLRFDKENPPIDLYRTERGGEVTYHGPGQLVLYPILNLRHQSMDLHWYLRMLEEIVIRTLWSACNLRASRVDGLTGVWVGESKVAAIGVRVKRWITYHGLALNVSTDLAPFQDIVPVEFKIDLLEV